MKETPILMQGHRVRSILDGRKTHTRRPMKPQPLSFAEMKMMDGPIFPEDVLVRTGPSTIRGRDRKTFAEQESPYGQSGDRLWVRETWRTEERPNGLDGIRYRADDLFKPIENTKDAAEAWVIARNNRGSEWRPSIHMPRWACRLVLEITDVRAERLQDITEDDAKAEGIDTSVTHPSPTGIQEFRAKNYVHAREAFADLWRLTYGHESWNVNPWVWVITFRRIKP